MLVAYNALLHFIGEMAQLDEALAVFEVMQRTGGPLCNVVHMDQALCMPCAPIFAYPLGLCHLSRLLLDTL